VILDEWNRLLRRSTRSSFLTIEMVASYRTPGVGMGGSREDHCYYESEAGI
jgi:hypothetical protein